MRNQKTSSQVKASRKSTSSTMQSAMRVAGYLRVSTDEQAGSGLGIAAQREKVKAQAVVKDWPEPVMYTDEGISGTKDATKRPALQRLLDDAHSGQLDAVIILSLDRLGRKTGLVLDLIEELAACGVIIISCKESLDTQSATGKFVVTLFASLAQLERDLIAERTKAALTELSKRGTVGGRMPYGYIRTDDGVEVDESLVPTVKFIFNARKRGDTLREIATKLTQKGVIGPRGGAWHHTAIAQILANKAAYSGGKRGESDVRWPAVLTP